MDSGTDTGKKMVVIDTTTKEIEERPIPSGGGSASQGAQYDFNYADGSGGWTALTSPRFYFDNSNNVITYEYHIQASKLLATLEMNINYDGGQFRFKDTAGTTTLAMLNVVKDGSGTGLHDLLITLCEKFQINAKVIIGDDLRVSGDVFLNSLIDSGTDTNKEMVVWDNTTAKIERRPIPTEKSVVSSTNPSTLTPDASTTKQINANAQAQALTINLPTNAFDGAKIIYRIKATSTSNLTWNAAFNDLKGSLPTSAPINKSIYVGVIYDAYSSIWDVVSVVEQS